MVSSDEDTNPLDETPLEELDGYELVDQWKLATHNHHFNSTNLRDLVRALDPKNYADLDDFLDDNPGACAAVADFVTEWVDRNRDWKRNLVDEIHAETSNYYTEDGEVKRRG